MTLGNFFRLIEEGGPNLTPARSLLQVYAREQNRDMLRDFYYSDDRRVDSAVLSLSEAASMSVSMCFKLAIGSFSNRYTGSHFKDFVGKSRPEVLL